LKLFTWGHGVFGQLGLGIEVKEKLRPGACKLNATVASVACGDNHTMVVTEGQQVFVCGHRDAIGGAHHTRLLQERCQQWKLEGHKLKQIFAGGLGCFATVKFEGGTSTTSLQAWGYNQHHQLGRHTNDLELLKPDATKLPRFVGSEVQAFSAGSRHCVAVLSVPTCCVLPPTGHKEINEPFFGSSPMTAALRGAVPYDVEVLTAQPGNQKLGAHRCALNIRNPTLAKRLRRINGSMWELDLSAYSVESISALLEFIYTDFCRTRADVAATLRPLAEELSIGRLVSGIIAATETESAGDGMRWVRTSEGCWKLAVAEQLPSLSLTKSTYESDLDKFVQEDSANLETEEMADYVELAVEQSSDDSTRAIHVAKLVLMSIPFFCALLEGPFAEAEQFRLGACNIPLQVGSTDALVLCLRMFAMGNMGLMPEDPEILLSIVVEAHRLELPSIVTAAEACIVKAATEGRVDHSLHDTFRGAAALYDLQQLNSVLGAVTLVEEDVN